jgi:hypothetical protein
MRTHLEKRRNKTAKALLSIYEAKDILREDQELFHKTISDLKTKSNSMSKREEVERSDSDGQGTNGT